MVAVVASFACGPETGLFAATDGLRGGEQEHKSGKQDSVGTKYNVWIVYALVLEDAGRTLDEINEVSPHWSDLSEFHPEMARADAQLHAAGVVHRIRDPWNIATRCPRTDDDNEPFPHDRPPLTLLNFEDATCRGDASYELALSSEQMYLQMVFGSAWEQAAAGA
ncbi:hypothetical protein CC85DRAFT_303185 [Cutaneotrichosporon oleaginosum]|uniref:Uncharacterized protein n=1 Tax=Cutaneotrichosporon oleaginosum TaxID=879819 RepID=A0A0J0XKB7_9TREE|nr:uncharacterized protein CC85DRAFT_303185 [Cutaneotrichosporon oleaginosum]KLT41507.1 hypothetical protein CC85DRAFT_303185 [Cutaneotrichosporon oleaginosum]TXT05844.1 hypothetical protein COLE_07164 [Cutaneotrichosporon oleaginosum]